MKMFSISRGSMDPRLRPMVVVLAMITLGAYIGSFLTHVIAYLWPDGWTTRVGQGEGFDHIWTSASVLVGSIVAIALGQPTDQPKALETSIEWWEDRLIIFYAWGWLIVGVIACAVWTLRPPQQGELLIKNAATAFIGLLIPVVSAFFREQKPQIESSLVGTSGPFSFDDPVSSEIEHRVEHSRMTLDLSNLDLAEHALSAAQTLKAKHPSVVFTSGRRSVAEQADAMASNIVRNRQWIAQTYAVSTERDTLQKWVDDNPAATARPAIAAGLSAIMENWSDQRRVKLSRHFAGLAFDIRPTDATVKKSIQELPHLVRFLDNEGGITIWHAEFASA